MRRKEKIELHLLTTKQKKKMHLNIIKEAVKKDVRILARTKARLEATIRHQKLKIFYRTMLRPLAFIEKLFTQFEASKLMTTIEQYLENKADDPAVIKPLMKAISEVRYRIKLLLQLHLPCCMINPFDDADATHVITHAEQHVSIVMMPLGVKQNICFKSKDNTRQHTGFVDPGYVLQIHHPTYKLWNSSLLPMSKDSPRRIMLVFSSDSTIQSMKRNSNSIVFI